MSTSPEFRRHESLPWPPPASPPLHDQQLDLWWIDGALLADLPRRQRTQQLLQGVLASYLPGQPLRWTREAKGRPWLDQPGAPDFNLSDTIGGSVVAVAARGRVGVDLEHLDRRPPVDRLARRWFSAAEAEALAALEPDCAAVAFLHLWTAKEAACKATGTGIFGWLPKWQFEVGVAQPQPRALPAEAGAVADWTFVRSTPTPGYSCVLACQDLRPQLNRMLRIITD